MPSDTIAALEWQVEQDMRCTSCGQPTYETLGPSNTDKWNAEVAGYCDGCRASHRAGAILAGRDELDPTVGVRFKMWKDSLNGAS